MDKRDQTAQGGQTESTVAQSGTKRGPITQENQRRAQYRVE